MRKMLCLVVVLAIVAPRSASAWGAVGHRLITDRAIQMLPSEIKPFFVKNHDELVLRSNDPDLWRIVPFDEEPPNHQIDLGASEYGPYPFTNLPREFGAALQKFGQTTLRRNGLLPWRTTEEFGNLQRILQGFSRNQLYVESNSVLFAATLAHYVEDAHQPLHVSNDFDGQFTGQSGLHSRFESELIERFETRLNLAPPPLAPVNDASAFIWDVILDANPLVAKIQEADKLAIAGKKTYDDEYYEKFFENIRPVLERQLSRSISATASAFVGAWQLAGRPVLKTDIPRQIQTVRPPR